MKVLLVHDTLTDFGGGERMVINLKKLLKERGHAVELIHLQEEKITYPFLRTIFRISVYRQTKIIIERFKPDIVHVHGCFSRLSPAPIIAARIMKIPVIMSVHTFKIICDKIIPCEYNFGKRCLFSKCYPIKKNLFEQIYYILKWFRTAYHRFLLKKCVYLFIAPSMLLTAKLKLSLRTNKVFFIPNFVDLGMNNEIKINNNYKQFLFVGRLSKEKGVDILLLAVKILKHKYEDIKVKIIGDGPEKNTLMKIAKDLDLEKNINFLGKIPNSKLFPFYRESICLLFPSICEENCPITILEAMKIGTPVIGSNIGGIPELVRENKTGFLFEPRNYQDLAHKILKILNNPLLAKKMGKNAQEIYNKEYHSVKHYTKLMKIYKNVLSS